MATKRIPELPAATTLAGTEQFEIVQTSTSKSVTMDIITDSVVAVIEADPDNFAFEYTDEQITLMRDYLLGVMAETNLVRARRYFQDQH